MVLGGKGKLAGKIRKRLQGGPNPLVDLDARLSRQPRALLDQRQCLLSGQLSGAELGGGFFEPRPELDQRIAHGPESSEPAKASLLASLLKPAFCGCGSCLTRD